MVNRRLVLKYGVASAGALMGARRATGAPTPGRPAEVPDLVLVDRELDGSDSLAAAVRARGLATLDFSNDVAGAWMREIEPRLRAGPATIEGYTSAATLFCLELLARDYGASVVRRGKLRDGVAWMLSSSPPRRAALAPRPSWSASHA